MHFLSVNAEPDHTANYNTQPCKIKSHAFCDNSQSHYFDLILSRVPVTTHTMVIVFPFSSRRSKGMRTGGVWEPCCWKGGLSCQLPGRTNASHHKGWTNWRSAILWLVYLRFPWWPWPAPLPAPFPVTRMHPNLLFTMIWPGATWGKKNHSFKCCVK